jgi:hypothetical protein
VLSCLPPSPSLVTPRVYRTNPLHQSRFKMIEVEGAPAHGSVAHLLPQTYKRYVSEWLEEDTPSFDYGGFVVGEELSEAKLLGKSEVGRF